MASSVKVGIAALVMLAAVAAIPGSSGAGTACFPGGCTIQFDDLTETPTAKVFNATGQDVTTQFPQQTVGELITVTIRDVIGTAQARYADLFEDQVDGTLSDRVLVVIGPQTAGSLLQATVTFASDPATIVLPTGATRADALVEDGTFQNLPLLSQYLGTNPLLTFQVRSDAPEAVPEPSTLLLLAGPLAGLVRVTWRRRRRSEAQA